MRFWLVALGLFCASAAMGQDPSNVQPRQGREVGSQTEVKEPADEEEAKDWTFEGNLQYFTAYMFRGYNNVDTGYIFQPELTLTRHLAINEKLSLDVYGSVWANYAEHTPKTSGPEHWNEFDAVAGVSFNLGEFSVALEYLYYNSPANDFDDIHE